MLLHCSIVSGTTFVRFSKENEACMGKEVQNKSNMYQKGIVTRNVAIMQMLCNQINECHQTANQLAESFHVI